MTASDGRQGQGAGMSAPRSASSVPAAGLPDYAELRCVSTFSFLVGASQPEELVERAHKQGYRALALTDECSVAGVVRAHVAAKKIGLKLLIGSQFSVAVPEPSGDDASWNAGEPEDGWIRPMPV